LKEQRFDVTRLGEKRMVVTQEPKRSQLRMGEKLIQGDGPIIEYRRRREELMIADC
jgi:hypothetical protein